MDRLKRRLPWLGPAAARVTASRPWQVYQHLEDRHWTRLAAAITFTSFLALFPVLALAAALCAALLTDRQRATAEQWFAEQVPGISGRLDIGSLFDNAATIGLIALALLLPTGVGWVDAMRGCLRAVWDLPDPKENLLLRKAKDLGVLVGLGGVTLLSLAASALAVHAAHWTSGWLGLARGATGGVLIQAVAHGVSLAVAVLLLAYVLVWLPAVRPPRRAVLVACLLGAAGFELLKALLSGYLTDVAARNEYGAFGVPIALLLWINLLAKLLLVCCAWTATAVSPHRRPAADALEAGDGGGSDTPQGPAAPDHRP